MKIRGIINYKTYEESSHQGGLRLAQEIGKLGHEILGVAPQAADLALISQNTRVPVFAQHVDPRESGRNTGYVTPRSVKLAGCVGTILGHSEHPVPDRILRDTVRLCQKEGLIVMACAGSLRQLQKHLKLRPDIIAYEAPELIATGRSVSRAKPEILKKSADIAKKFGVPLWCGAGISSVEDVQRALEIGAEGVLISSWIVKAKNRACAVDGLVRALKDL